MSPMLAGRLGGVVFGTGNYVDLCTAGAYGYVEARSEDGELDFIAEAVVETPAEFHVDRLVDFGDEVVYLGCLDHQKRGSMLWE